MLLAELIPLYVAARNAHRPIGRELADKSVEHLIESERAFSRYLGRPARVEDLQAGIVNELLRQLVKDGRSPYTAKTRRSGILLLWRFAFREGLTAHPYAGVRNVACPPLAITGYSLEDMSRFVAYVATLRGVVRRTGIPKRIYWVSFLRTDWEVGARISDMMRVRAEHFDPQGWLWLREQKTGKAGWRRLRESTAETIAACIAENPSRERIWPGYTRKNAYRIFRQLADLAGVQGTSRYIRRGGSSEYDRLHPGNGWRFLRHSTPEVWERHYRVDKIVDADASGPPEIPRG